MLIETVGETAAGRRLVNKTFRGGVVDLDGGEFVGCVFRGTTVRYSGGELPRIENCSFIDTKFVMDGAAQRTVHLLQAMSLPGSGLQRVIRETFRTIFSH